MKYAIAGITGFIGTQLSQYLQNKGHQVLPITRNDFIPENADKLINILEGTDCVINLAGAPINKRWSSSYKKELYYSRINTTRKLVQALNKVKNPPKTFISTSAVGYYAPHICFSEFTAQNGNDFLAQLCRNWEYEALQVRNDIRCVTPRFGVVISEYGGMFPQIIAPIKRTRVAVQVGNGDNQLSWIHLTDLLRCIYLASTNIKIRGVYNFTSPQPVTFKYLTALLAKHYHALFTFVVPPSLVKLYFKEGVTLFTQDICAKPDRLLMMGFKFKYPYIDNVITDLK
ncbi:MAG: TIGR01777 family oxidoreductase [Marinifilaceae bacterium]